MQNITITNLLSLVAYLGVGLCLAVPLSKLLDYETKGTRAPVAW